MLVRRRRERKEKGVIPTHLLRVVAVEPLRESLLHAHQPPFLVPPQPSLSPMARSNPPRLHPLLLRRLPYSTREPFKHEHPIDADRRKPRGFESGNAASDADIAAGVDGEIWMDDEWDVGDGKRGTER